MLGFLCTLSSLPDIAPIEPLSAGTGTALWKECLLTKSVLTDLIRFCYSNTQPYVNEEEK